MTYQPLVATVAGAVGGVFGMATRPQGPPNFQSELFDCMQDSNVCMQTCCCVWCTESNIINKREKNIADLDPMVCCGACCLDYFTRFFSSAFVFGLRRELILRYGIQGEPYVNTCVANICGPCSLCQLQREMIMRSEAAGGLCAAAPPGNAAVAMGMQMGAAAVAYGGAALMPVQFGSGPFDCNAMECFDAWCCSPCTLAHMTNKLDMGRVPLIPMGSENKFDPATCCAAFCCLPQFAYATRREVIDKYGINTEPHLMSYLLTVFCPCCTIAQTRREMSYRGEWPGGILVTEVIVKMV